MRGPLEKEVEKKYGKIIYDATIDTTSPIYFEKKKAAKKYFRLTTLLFVLVSLGFIPLWVEAFSFPITHPGTLMTILTTVLFFTGCSHAIIKNFHICRDPRARVFLTENGIFYGFGLYWPGYHFIRYDEIVDYRKDITPMGLEILDIITKNKVRKMFKLANDIAVEDIRDLHEFMKKLSERVSRKIENDEDNPYFMMPYKR